VKTWHCIAFLIVTAIAMRYVPNPGDRRDRRLRGGMVVVLPTFPPDSLVHIRVYTWIAWWRP
jgi:hypothetical protein